MTAVTNTVNIQDTAVTLSRKVGADKDFTYPDFTASDANLGFRPTLLFRVSPNVSGGSVELELRLNGTVIQTTTFDTEPSRAYMELIASGILTETGNVLEAEAKSGLGEVTLSNMVLFYQRVI